jgi:signal transduction histidine kinase
MAPQVAAAAGQPDVSLVPILLVDDEPVNFAALESILEPGGYRCMHAQTADQALLQLLNHDFAAIILDIRLQGMTGIELARLIKQRRRSVHIPILFLTAHLLEETDILRGYDTGAVDYLTKPVNPDILRSKIAVFADLYRKSRALEHANETLQGQIAQREAVEDELRRINQELEQRVEARTAELSAADQRKDEFLASLAHELRNPLGALQSAAEVIRLTAPDSPELQSSQRVITRQIRQMTRLVDDLLDVSRITRGRLVLRKSQVGLWAVIDDALEMNRPVLEAYGHTLTVHRGSEAIHIEGDAIRLAQVVANLLDNASKYTPSGQRIELDVQVVGSKVQISVEDNGIGIEAALLPKVFDLFFQADAAEELARGGLGIGLTLVRRLVELHGGTVEASSSGLGKGSRFVVHLPQLLSSPALAVAVPGAVELVPSAGGGLRVLIVEDNPDAADTLKIVVGTWGHTVQIARDGLTALEAAEAFRPHAVLLDIGLPRLDGHAVASRLRAKEWCREIMIVAITGRSMDADRQRSEDVGIDRHLLKPVDIELLRGLLADAHAKQFEGAPTDFAGR